MTSIATIGGGLLALIVALVGAFAGGRRDGKKGLEIDLLEDEIELRKQYEEIDNAPDSPDPFSLL